MLKIRLKSEESPLLPLPAHRKREDVTLPRSRLQVLPHLCRDQLPEARGAGTIPIGAPGETEEAFGYAVRRRNGAKVHICVRCNFPIAIYGRLHPCDHIFCLTCATKDSSCFLCDEKVSRVKKIDLLDGVFICGAPRCLKSFLDKQALELHITEQHKDLLLADQEPQFAQQQQQQQEHQDKVVLKIERQSRQQQFRNAQQQRQMDQQRKHPKNPKFGYSPNIPDYNTLQQDGQNFYAAAAGYDDNLPGFG